MHCILSFHSLSSIPEVPPYSISQELMTYSQAIWEEILNKWNTEKALTKSLEKSFYNKLL